MAFAEEAAADALAVGVDELEAEAADRAVMSLSCRALWIAGSYVCERAA
ncbi:hypothetical protein K2X89_15085 [Myxococcota bacterium]|nr:hypothetical protein [Myxococcota bacterium]